MDTFMPDFPTAGYQLLPLANKKPAAEHRLQRCRLNSSKPGSRQSCVSGLTLDPGRGRLVLYPIVYYRRPTSVGLNFK